MTKNQQQVKHWHSIGLHVRPVEPKDTREIHFQVIENGTPRTPPLTMAEMTWYAQGFAHRKEVGG